MLLAKARQDKSLLADNLAHFRLLTRCSARAPPLSCNR